MEKNEEVEEEGTKSDDDDDHEEDDTVDVDTDNNDLLIQNLSKIPNKLFNFSPVTYCIKQTKYFLSQPQETEIFSQPYRDRMRRDIP